jgi:hypothetical protein
MCEPYYLAYWAIIPVRRADAILCKFSARNSDHAKHHAVSNGDFRLEHGGDGSV